MVVWQGGGGAKTSAQGRTKGFWEVLGWPEPGSGEFGRLTYRVCLIHWDQTRPGLGER